LCAYIFINLSIYKLNQTVNRNNIQRIEEPPMTELEDLCIYLLS